MLEMLCKRYFRVSGRPGTPADAGQGADGGQSIGRAPVDGLVLRTAARMQRPELPPLRWLSEDSVFHYLLLGMFMNRLGAVRVPGKRRALAVAGQAVVAFLEGAQDRESCSVTATSCSASAVAAT